MNDKKEAITPETLEKRTLEYLVVLAKRIATKTDTGFEIDETLFNVQVGKKEGFENLGEDVATAFFDENKQWVLSAKITEDDSIPERQILSQTVLHRLFVVGRDIIEALKCPTGIEASGLQELQEILEERIKRANHIVEKHESAKQEMER